MINILIRDSSYTSFISRNLKEHFGERVVCYQYALPPRCKIDLFILSGVDVIDSGGGICTRLKRMYGSPRAKVFVGSVDEDYLRTIKEKRLFFGVNFTFSKSNLFNGFPREFFEDIINQTTAATATNQNSS